MTWENEKGKADAYLIAAAPDLLGSAKEWLSIWLYLRDNYPDIELPDSFDGQSDACGRLRSAIAKAEGNVA